MDSLELSVQNHSEFHNLCQKLKLILKEQREKIRENENTAAEKDIIAKKIDIFKVNNIHLKFNYLIFKLIILGNEISKYY